MSDGQIAAIIRDKKSELKPAQLFHQERIALSRASLATEPRLVRDLVFVQGRGQIIEKKIGSDSHRGDKESLIVDRDTILGFSRDISIVELDASSEVAGGNFIQNIYAIVRSYMRPTNRLVRVFGRGTIYLETYSAAERSRESWLLSEEEYVQAFERLLN